jgi:DNA-binding transcriptional LysR family regulator
MLDLRRLRTFREVAVARSFSAAADRLDYTQSTVSQQVASLERELRTTLLDRTARPVRPTPAGELVLRRAEDLIGRAQAIEDELQALAGGRVGLLRVGGFSTAWGTFMPPAISAFGQEYPDVGLELDELEPEPALDAVSNGRLDTAVVYFVAGRGEEIDDRLTRIHLLEDPYVLVLPRDHVLAGRANLRLADLAEERWVSAPVGAPYSLALRDLLREEGDFVPQFHEVRDIALAQPLIAAGLAVALLPALSVLQAHPGVVVRALPATQLVRSVLAVRLSGHESPATDRMVMGLTKSANRVSRTIKRSGFMP